MRIIIETDGTGRNTEIYFNGEKQTNLNEFQMTIRALRNVKIQLVKEIDGKKEFLSYYGDDLKKYDEVNKPK